MQHSPKHLIDKKYTVLYACGLISLRNWYVDSLHSTEEFTRIVETQYFGDKELPSSSESKNDLMYIYSYSTHR